jgi:hypothetical protein
VLEKTKLDSLEIQFSFLKVQFTVSFLRPKFARFIQFLRSLCWSRVCNSMIFKPNKTTYIPLVRASASLPGTRVGWLSMMKSGIPLSKNDLFT